MDAERFWRIIADTCRSDALKVQEWDERLQAALKELEPDEIIGWNFIFDRMADQAYTVDLWGAAYLINGGASDDGFYYFRCWLVGMGRDVYEAAVANPDSLADVVIPDIDAEAEIYAAAHQAWMAVTRRPATASYPTYEQRTELRGHEWDFNDDAEVRRRFPRLAAMYLDS